MQNVESVACVKFQSWGKILALNIRCFVKNGHSISIWRSFCKLVLEMEELIVKKIGQRDLKSLFLIPCGIKGGNKGNTNGIILHFLLFCCHFGFGAIHSLPGKTLNCKKPAFSI